MDELTDGMTLAIEAPSSVHSVYVHLLQRGLRVLRMDAAPGWLQTPPYRTVYSSNRRRGKHVWPNVLEPTRPFAYKLTTDAVSDTEVPVASWSHTTGGYVAGRRGVSTLDVTGDRDKAASFERSSEGTTFLVPYSVTAAGSGHCR
jgi:hypothetical protein